MAGVDATQELRSAIKELQAVTDKVATTLYKLMLEEHWIVPPSHRPTCPLSNKPCTSWTCLVDVCVDPTKEKG